MLAASIWVVTTPRIRSAYRPCLRLLICSNIKRLYYNIFGSCNYYSSLSRLWTRVGYRKVVGAVCTSGRWRTCESLPGHASHGSELLITLIQTVAIFGLVEFASPAVAGIILSFASCDHARFRRSARVATTRITRRASLTDFESGKASATSGSRSTTLVPRQYWSTYLPRTPPEKSYSALISTTFRLEGRFLMLAFFMSGRSASADQPDSRSSNSMSHDQQTSLARQPDDHITFFVTRVVWVCNRNR